MKKTLQYKCPPTSQQSDSKKASTLGDGARLVFTVETHLLELHHMHFVRVHHRLTTPLLESV